MHSKILLCAMQVLLQILIILCQEIVKNSCYFWSHMGYYFDRIDLKNSETKRGELKVLTGPHVCFLIII